MSKKVICVIAQFPPPIHGLSKAVETLCDSELNNIYEFEKVNITPNKHFLKNMIKILYSKADFFYFTISQTRGGNFRDLVILWLLALQKKKCLIHLHGGYYRTLIEHDLPKWQKKVNYNVIKKISGAIVLSDTLKNIFRDMVEEDKIYVVENCIDDEYLLKNDVLTRKFEVIENDDVRRVLYLSNMIRSKGYAKVLEIAKLEKERCELGGKRKFHFDFAGIFFDKREEKYFYSYIQENNLQDYVTYHGGVIGDKKRELLEKSIYFVLLTSYPKEGQPISILEAMGNAMMILTTCHAGIPDVVKDTENGRVFSIETSVEEIYRAMIQTDNKNLIKICLHNRECVEKRFMEKHYIYGLKKVFESIE